MMKLGIRWLHTAAGAIGLVLFALVLLCGAASAAEDEARSHERRAGGDLFIAGGTVTVREAVSGDLFAAGGSIDVDAEVAGDAVATGGKVRLGANVGQTVYAAGGQLGINGKVGRNVRVAGGQVELAPQSDVAGNVSVAGGQVRLLGAVRGHVQAAGGRVRIDGVVGGDVSATAGQVELGPNARIAGKLRYRSRDALRQDPAAQVAGGVETLFAGEPPPASAPPTPQARTGGHGFGWLWTAGLVLLAALLLATLPRFCERVARSLREHIGLSLLLGFVWLVCVPVAALVLLLTLVGIPLAFLAVALYFALLPVGYVSAAIGGGDWALQKWHDAGAGRLGWRVGAAAAVLVGLTLLGQVPWLGGLLAGAALLAGLGALLLQLRRLAPGAT